jgi:hypothetical protein
MSTDVNRTRRRRVDSEQGLLIMVAALVVLGAAAVMAVAGL